MKHIESASNKKKKNSFFLNFIFIYFFISFVSVLVIVPFEFIKEIYPQKTDWDLIIFLSYLSFYFFYFLGYTYLLFKNHVQCFYDLFVLVMVMIFIDSIAMVFAFSYFETIFSQGYYIHVLNRSLNLVLPAFIAYGIFEMKKNNHKKEK